MPAPYDLQGQAAVVTGSTSGIGQALAEALAAQGVNLVLNGLGDAAKIAADRARIAAEHGVEVRYHGADMTRPDEIADLVAFAEREFGRLDILVNNAGITRDQLLLRMKRDDWDAVVATNLTGTFLCTQSVLKTMLKQRSGRIISISSVVGQSGNPGQTNYAATKAGIIGFSKALAREVASRSITVNVVAPGLIDTDMTRDISQDAQANWASAIPLGRLGTPEDVAAAVCFLASDAAGYITGQVLAVNGGMYA